MDTETLLTVREAAVKIGVSESAIRNATLEGRLPFVVKFGRKLIEMDAIDVYQQRTQADGLKPRGGRPRTRDHNTGESLARETQGADAQAEHNPSS